MAVPRVGLLDIETAPITGHAWTMFEANICHVIEPTFMLSYSWKWLDQKTIKTRALCDYPKYLKNRFNDKALVSDLHADLDSADIVIAHNGDAFDIKKTNARMIVHGLLPPSPYKQIDTLKIARKHFKFDSNKLDNIARYLRRGRKLPHTGMDLWLRCMAGDLKAWALMKRYNAHDVKLLEEIFLDLRPWATGLPSMTAYDDAPGCPSCRSPNVQRRGFNVAKKNKTQRIHCQNCGAWFPGAIIKKGAA